MPPPKLSEAHLKFFRPLERKLREAAEQGDVDAAIRAAEEMQSLLPEDPRHHRILKAWLVAYEACVDANRLEQAEPGLVRVRRHAGATTRLRLEATALLSIVLLRQKNTPAAMQAVQETFAGINNIAAANTRHLFQRQFLERLDEECILAELIGTGDQRLDPQEIHDKAVLLIERSSQEEIFRLIGSQVPPSGPALLTHVRTYALSQLPPPDRPQLPPPRPVEEPSGVGKTTFDLMRRIAWKTLCKPDSPVYKLWSKQIPRAFNETYLAGAVVTALADFRIGATMLASGVLAIALKYGAEEFCERAKPKSLLRTGRKDA